MKRWAFLLGGASLLALAGAAEARMHHPYRGHRIVPVASAPLDGFTSPSGAYSFRKLKSSYAGSAVRLRRASDNLELDIGFVGADFNAAVATAHCAATTCFIRWMYDQSGNALHIGQATVADQPELIFNCNGALPCSRSAIGTQRGLSKLGGVVPASPLTLNAVAKQTARSTTACREIYVGVGNELSQATSTDFVLLSNGSTTINAPSTGLAWHSHTSVTNGASSVINVDGVETTGTLALTLTSGSVVVNYNNINGATCDLSEAMYWSGYALTAGERTALANNQKDYYTPLPLDTFTTPSGAYSFRKLKSAYSGPAIRIRRASDNAELDIGFLGFTSFTGAPWDEASAAAHCAATTCFGVTWYDQSVAARNMTQATAGNQPTLVFNCKGSLPCWRLSSSATGTLATASVTPATGVLSMSAVANRDSGSAGTCNFIRQNGNLHRLQATGGAANNWGALGASGSIYVPAADGTWHSGQAVINGASSSMTVDGTTVAGTATGGVTAGLTQILGSGTSVCSFGEAILWDAYVLTTAEIAALTANQRAFWGTP